MGMRTMENYWQCTRCNTESNQIAHKSETERLCHSCDVLTKPDCYLCSVCNAWESQSCWSVPLGGMCINCRFWHDLLAKKDISVRVANHHYIIEPEMPKGYGGFLGFGGARWDVLFNDGRKVVTHNLWHQGLIPERWRSKLPDNAVFEQPF